MTGLNSVEGIVGVNSTGGVQAKESAKAKSLVFVLLDFQHAGVRRRV